MIKKEFCILCGKQVDHSVTDNISLRKFYIEGAGQLCEKCYNKIYSEKERKVKNDFFNK